MTANTCPYCLSQSKLTTGEYIYPHRRDLSHLFFYLCEPCDAYVGCHGTSKSALGRLANAELRKAKSSAHKAFDPIWKLGHLTRSGAYDYLSYALNIESKHCHIGSFSVEQCNAVVLASSKYLSTLKDNNL